LKHNGSFSVAARVCVYVMFFIRVVNGRKGDRSGFWTKPSYLHMRYWQSGVLDAVKRMSLCCIRCMTEWSVVLTAHAYCSGAWFLKILWRT